MFCPKCGAAQNDDLRFCKTCGSNLHAVRQAVAMRDTGDKFDWSKSWVAEMFLSEGELKKRNEEIERERGVTPEIKRDNEIKAGIVTSAVGLGSMIFLYALMQGIVLSGQTSQSDAAILTRIWLAGAIPFLVGIALIINGVFLTKRHVEIFRQEQLSGQNVQASGREIPSLRSGETTEFNLTRSSVTEGTTKHLAKPNGQQ